MSGTDKTYLYCYDDRRSFSEEIRNRFSDQARYSLFIYHNSDDFINQIIKEKENRFCNIAIIGVHEAGEDIPIIDQLMANIRTTNNSIRIIMICHPEKIGEIKKKLKLNADSYIPNNSNLILRTHNIVKKIISEYHLSIFRSRRNLSIYVLAGFVLIALILGAIAFFVYPQYF
jgi:hypothetical protein